MNALTKASTDMWHSMRERNETVEPRPIIWRRNTRAWIAVCVAGVVALLVAASAAQAEFGVAAFDGQVTANQAGDAFTQAGGHPFEVSTTITFNTFDHPIFGPEWPEEAPRSILVDLPPGFIGNPNVGEKCRLPDLANFLPTCPVASQVGVMPIQVPIDGSNQSLPGMPVFLMVPPPNVPARLGVNVFGTVIVLDAELRSGTDYGLSLRIKNISEGVAFNATNVTLWGVPADPIHDAQRLCPGGAGLGCSSQAQVKPFVRNPTACTPGGAGLTTTLRTDSWADPGDFKTASFVSHLPPGYSMPGDPFPLSPLPADQWGAPQGPTGCDLVPFDPSFTAAPGSVNSPARAGKPASFEFDIELPQSEVPGAIATGDLKKAVVTLPQGVRLSPSAVDGLGACSPAEIALNTTAAPTCPDNSKVGTVRIDTPLLEEPVTGAVYLGKPHDNPFGTLLSIYLVAEGPGLFIKLAGKVEADPATGQLTTTFDDNPQLPFTRLHLALNDGARAPLVLPATCGSYTTHATLTSWSGKTVELDNSFALSHDGHGAPCPPQGFSPDFAAGVENPVAGASSPFLLSLSRDDGEQELGGLSIGMPKGLLARIADVSLCPETQMAAGTCGEASRIGSVTVGAGAGPAPFFIQTGRVYIGGSYKGAPFSLSVVVPAVAGPFDLGTVVVRAAIHVDRRTTALRIVSDPLPTILQGIPLQVRVLRVDVDREGFTINPTSCQPKRVDGTVESTAGAVADVSSRFQVGNCNALRFRPRMSLTVGAKGHTRVRSSTPLVATLTQTPGQAGLKSLSVTLPLALNARLPVVNNACTVAEFDAGDCESARAGTATAVTPLLEHALSGGAYFVKNPAGGLPNLIIALRGEVDFDLVGKVTIPEGQRLRTTFTAAPDVPVKRFTLRLVAGRRGPLGVAENLCTKSSRRQAATITMRGQNGKSIELRPRLRVVGCGKGGAGR